MKKRNKKAPETITGGLRNTGFRQTSGDVKWDGEGVNVCQPLNEVYGKPVKREEFMGTVGTL